MSRRPRHWLTQGTDRCHVCTHAHVYEMTVHCVACDRGLCMHCVIIERSTGETWCPSCRAAESVA